MSVDIAVGFFSAETLAYYFDPNLNPDECDRREREFMNLIGRQVGQKGTLLYDNGRTYSKCYFDSPPRGATLATTGQLRIRGQRYDSLFSYYQATNPNLPVLASTPAVRVSFEGIDRPQPIAADRVRARIMNDDLPDDLADVDKIPPAERRQLIESFWTLLGPKPFGFVAPGVKDGFWRPPVNRITRFTMPMLTFGNGKQISPPERMTVNAYKQNFQERLQALKEAGYYHVPANITRTLHIPYPKTLGEEAGTNLAAAIVEQMNQGSDKPITAQPFSYDSLSAAIEQLRDYGDSGMAVFVLNSEPSIPDPFVKTTDREK